jgi:ATP-dependent RNA helicase DDX59
MAASGGGEHSSDPAVKQRSEQQRPAEPGEPVCAVCGRYGEYICDATDDDVCSLECKAVIVARHEASQPRSKEVVAPELLRDECVVVRDQGNKLPEWIPDESIAKLSQKQVDALLQGIEVSVKGEDIPRPILQFLDCKFLPKLQGNLEAAGYDTPTPVQMQAIPAALRGRDVLVSAETGSGKTASFLLPIIMRCSLVRIHGLSERDKPLAMVLTPTRELCAQVSKFVYATDKEV